MIVSHSQMLRFSGFFSLVSGLLQQSKKATAARIFSLSAPTVRCSHIRQIAIFFCVKWLENLTSASKRRTTLFTINAKQPVATNMNGNRKSPSVMWPLSFIESKMCRSQVTLLKIIVMWIKTHTHATHCKHPCAGVCTTMLSRIQSMWSSSVSLRRVRK